MALHNTIPAIAMPESFQPRSFRFALGILQLFRALGRDSNAPRHLLHQMLRAGTSIGANLEEANSAYSRRDLAFKYTIAVREARECHYWLRLVVADQPDYAEVVAPLLDECGQLVAILTASILKLRSPETV